MTDDAAAAADRWVRAVESVAERQRIDRNVDKPSSVTNEYDTLWANFGGLRVSVSGTAAEVRNETELFELIDRWVAFELLDSEDSLIDRDREYIAQWRARLPAQQRIWEQAAELVFDDLDPGTSGYGNWRIVLEEDQLDLPRRFDLDSTRQGVWSEAVIHPPGWTPPVPARRPLLLPHFAITTDTCGTSLFMPIAQEGVRSLSEAVAFLADWLQEDIIDHTWTAWPRCPDHEHPLSLAGPNHTTWTCPATGEAIAEVGHLRDRRASGARPEQSR